MSLSIQHLTCDDGYDVVLINGSVDFEGHGIPTFYWVDLLKSYGFQASSKTISNRAMEEGNFFLDEV